MRSHVLSGTGAVYTKLGNKRPGGKQKSKKDLSTLESDDDDKMFNKRWIFVELLASKSDYDTLPTLQMMINRLEALTGTKTVYRLHSDQGKAFLSHAVET